MECKKLRNASGALPEFVSKHLKDCGAKTKFQLSESAYWAFGGFLRNSSGQQMKKWASVKVVSDYARREPIWQVQKPTKSDFASKKLWAFCPKCVVEAHFTLSIAEFRDFVEMHLAMHPSDMSIFVSAHLFKFQDFDSRQIRFIVSKDVPDWFKVRKDPTATFRQHLERFQEGISEHKDAYGCLVYTDQRQRSQFYGRDVFSFDESRLVGDSTNQRTRRKVVKIRPQYFFWVANNGVIPADKFLQSKCDNSFCVNLEHLTLACRHIPVLDLL